jgi:hypothetical protein
LANPKQCGFINEHGNVPQTPRNADEQAHFSRAHQRQKQRQGERAKTELFSQTAAGKGPKADPAEGVHHVSRLKREVRAAKQRCHFNGAEGDDEWKNEARYEEIE